MAEPKISPHDSVCQTRGHDCDEVDALLARVEEQEDELKRLRERLQEVEEDRNGAIHREHEASEQMRFCHKILDRIGAPRNQDNGLSYHLNGRLSRLVRNETGKLWEAEMQSRERVIRMLAPCLSGIGDQEREALAAAQPYLSE